MPRCAVNFGEISVGQLYLKIEVLFVNCVKVIYLSLRPGAPPLSLQQPAPFVQVHACMVLKPVIHRSTGERTVLEKACRAAAYLNGSNHMSANSYM